MGFQYPPFDDDIITELPSCVYANQHLSNSPPDTPIEAFINRSNLGLCTINPSLRQQIQQQYNLHHHTGKTLYCFLDLTCFL